MDNFRLSKAPLSMKLLFTSLLCIVGLIYISLLLNIYLVTNMKVAMISEGYGSMEITELAEHAQQFLPFYVIFLFTLPTLLFMFTSYSEKLKRVLAIFPFVVIVIDISSMWLIPYVSKSFSYVLWLAGTILATTFLLLFLLNMYDIWLRKIDK